jgi:hypothetical protein
MCEIARNAFRKYVVNLILVHFVITFAVQDRQIERHKFCQKLLILQNTLHTAKGDLIKT